MIEKVLMIVIIFFIIYFLNKISIEKFNNNINKINIKIHIINTIPTIKSQKIRNYFTYPYVKVMLIKTLNDIFKKTNKHFNLEKIIEYDYRNNLRNKYQHISSNNNNSKHITDKEINQFINNDIDVFNKIITYDNPPILLEELVDNMCDDNAFDLKHTHIIVVPYLKEGILKINNKIIIGLYKNDIEKTIPHLSNTLCNNWINNYYNDIISKQNIKEKIANSKSKCDKMKYAPQLNKIIKSIDTNRYYIKYIKTIEILAHLLNIDNSDINISQKYDSNLFTSDYNINKCDVVQDKNKLLCNTSLNYMFDSKLDNDNITSLLQNHIENPNLNDSLKNSLTEDLNYFNPSKDTNTDELLSYIENIDTDKVDHNCSNKLENEIKYKSRNAYLNSDNYYLNTFSQSYI
jgi:hypothetical protein